ncbi:MAG: polymerase [Acidobacteriota bacterium]|jgi:DNA polymerase V|nr:polymerase [Acidobacteriota bacterium]
MDRAGQQSIADIPRNIESKALGITMGMPFFKARDLIERHGIIPFSSNYNLYGDMSRRVMDTIETVVPAQERYSIDETFVQFDEGQPEREAHRVKQTVQQWTGIPVSVGIGPTKVLAKVANKIAKRKGETGGVVDLSNAETRDRYLKEFDVADVWGIGPRSSAFLKSEGKPSEVQPDLWEASGLEPLLKKRRVETVYELMQCSDQWIRKHLTIRGLRLVWELRGISCLPLEAFEKPKQGICCSRAFGQPVMTLEALGEGVSMHAARGGEKLRRQRLAASHLTVFISTSRFHTRPEEIYSASASMRLVEPTFFTADLVSAAKLLVERIYKPGFQYRKAGIYLADIVPQRERQQSFLLHADAEKRERVMAAVDEINRRHGRHTLRPLSMGFKHQWQMKREMLSPHYTTNWREVPKVRVEGQNSL